MYSILVVARLRQEDPGVLVDKQVLVGSMSSMTISGSMCRLSGPQHIQLTLDSCRPSTKTFHNFGSGSLLNWQSNRLLSGRFEVRILVAERVPSSAVADKLGGAEVPLSGLHG